MARYWRLHLGSDERSAICPNCGHDGVRRSRRKNALEKTVLRGLSLHPYRCSNCRHRYFTLGPIQRKITPAETSPDSAHAR